MLGTNSGISMCCPLSMAYLWEVQRMLCFTALSLWGLAVWERSAPCICPAKALTFVNLHGSSPKLDHNDPELTLPIVFPPGQNACKAEII